MEILQSRDLNHLLNVMTIINSSLDKDIFRQTLLEYLLKMFHMENSIFFLTDENSKLTDMMGINIEEKYHRDFLSYYYQFDPFHLIQGPLNGNKVISLEELVSYSTFIKTEYYNDFLYPQRIHYKTVVYLKSEKTLWGIIGLFRPKQYGNFSKKEKSIIKILAPYITQALKNIELLRRIQLENSILKMVDRESTSGLIILNDQLELIHMNRRASEFCKFLDSPSNSQTDSDHSKNHSFQIPNFIKEDCFRLREQMKQGFWGMAYLPVCRILKISELKKYSVCYQVLPREMNPDKQIFYSIKIIELTQPLNLNLDALEMDFGLTKREIEILTHIFNGLKNAEIASKLCITEITVKKHLQHIFEKIGVDSRTALIRRIIDYRSIQS